MATPHLTCNQPEGTTQSKDRKLNACDNHLLVLKKNTAWTNKELIITPCEENFATAVVYGQSSYYNNRSTGSRDDGNTVTNRMATLWGGMGIGAWQTGHKPCFAYTARGGCPYMIKVDSNYTNESKYLEMGQCRQLLRFNCHCLPVGSATSFKAYLRFWNPSWVQALQTFAKGNSYIYNFGYNKSAYVSYHFDTEVPTPNAYETTNYGEARFARNYGETSGTCLANENRGTSSGATATTCEYDVWMTRSVTARSSYYAKMRTQLYHHYDASKYEYNTSAYYADHEITGNALSLLKKCIMSGKFYMTIGFHNANMIYPASGSGITGMWEGSTILGYFSRVELRFVLSMPRLNY